ncbi:chitin deacetylase 7-like [Gigantopelta aegis]|uniref:chitin deacetylase 7-like n=1 Tax=Gigantopelta aegis TaxID=1735272 RepID=UPI001B88AC16|nr:chitin deacetylase 7-like [Gigantopelta aegis]
MGFRVMFCVFGLLLLVTLLDANSAAEDRCTSYNCKLPDCRCPGLNVPGDFKQDEVPQMVLITFDDAVNWENWDFYRELFPPDLSRLNPNGCPVSTTLFVSNKYTDYCMVRKLHARGIEIADHSVTHRLPN